jgi:hypothetical protein
MHSACENLSHARINTHTLTLALMHTDTDTHRHTQTHTDTHRHTHTHRHTDTQIHRHTDTLTHTHTHTHTRTHRHTQRDTYPTGILRHFAFDILSFEELPFDEINRPNAFRSKGVEPKKWRVSMFFFTES